MQSNYIIWGRDIIKGACSLGPMTGFDDDWQLLDGVPLSGSFPSTASFKMDTDDPRSIMLTDCLYNADRVIVASEKLHALLAATPVYKVEYLPVPIYNHKNRKVPESYYIAHPLEPIDCLVVDACRARWSTIDKTNIDRLRSFVIDESKINPTRLLFRPMHYKRAILVHRKLAKKIDTAGCNGVRWIELADYPEQ